uniref:Uncharacterized protein n=1 Tax=Aegilops tauschii subsp. strangulata TaxID=200361 RepID=A0A452YQW4_AEGTS
PPTHVLPRIFFQYYSPSKNKRQVNKRTKRFINKRNLSRPPPLPRFRSKRKNLSPRITRPRTHVPHIPPSPPQPSAPIPSLPSLLFQKNRRPRSRFAAAAPLLVSLVVAVAEVLAVDAAAPLLVSLVVAVAVAAGPALSSSGCPSCHPRVVVVAPPLYTGNQLFSSMGPDCFLNFRLLGMRAIIGWLIHLASSCPSRSLTLPFLNC